MPMYIKIDISSGGRLEAKVKYRSTNNTPEFLSGDAPVLMGTSVPDVFSRLAAHYRKLHNAKPVAVAVPKSEEKAGA